MVFAGNHKSVGFPTVYLVFGKLSDQINGYSIFYLKIPNLYFRVYWKPY